MFYLESTLDGSTVPVKNDILMKDGEAGVYGELMVATAGRLTKCSATGRPQFILLSDVAAGTNVKVDYLPLTRQQTFLADVYGNINSLPLGSKTVAIYSDGLKVDANTLTGGCVEIVKLDTAKNKARVRFDL